MLTSTDNSFCVWCRFAGSKFGAGTGRSADDILGLFLGSEAQLAETVTALRTTRRWRAPRFLDDVTADVLDLPSWKHFQEAREVLLAEHMNTNASGMTQVLSTLRSALDQVDALLATHTRSGNGL